MIELPAGRLTAGAIFESIAKVNMDSSQSVPNYKPGESLMVRIDTPEPGGYAVKLLPTDLDGFLPSQEVIGIGKIVPATFVCMDKHRALLTYAFMIGTTERVQLSTLSDQENAFAVWADSYPRSFKLKRAIDMIMPPFGTTPETEKSGGRPKLLEELEKGLFTGCMKAASDENFSRSAALLYKGRAVGCIYGKRPMVDAYPTETALELMVTDLANPDTDVQVYELPDGLVLSMSAFFLGCAVERMDHLDEPTYLSEITSKFQDDKQTGCLSFATSPDTPNCFCFFFDGNYLGAFDVDNQQFISDMAYLETLPSKHGSAKFEAHLLPPEMTSERVRFGFNVTAVNPLKRLP